jgi:hypothetical protein
MLRISVVQRVASFAGTHLLRIAEGLAANTLNGPQTEQDQNIDPPPFQAGTVTKIWR